MNNHRVFVRAQAEADIASAATWYDKQSPGLGTEYLRAVDVCIAAIARNPAMFATVYRSVRRALLRRFPYGLFFLVDNESVVILACLHGKQSPGRIRSRI
jgi:plasmid stabilization system protein ParE